MVRRYYRSLKLAVPTAKPFEQQELHATVTICPELQISSQKLTQK
jgi:hypothetical protein